LRRRVSGTTLLAIEMKIGASTNAGQLAKYLSLMIAEEALSGVKWACFTLRRSGPGLKE
jgi:hypothetical protein